MPRSPTVSEFLIQIFELHLRGKYTYAGFAEALDSGEPEQCPIVPNRHNREYRFQFEAYNSCHLCK